MKPMDFNSGNNIASSFPIPGLGMASNEIPFGISFLYILHFGQSIGKSKAQLNITVSHFVSDSIFSDIR